MAGGVVGGVGGRMSADGRIGSGRGGRMAACMRDVVDLSEEVIAD
jgi:hypothetical protein